ncbi:hypothetical protein JM83_1600 [Gillisia sp. Hel_I_86]|nr:hypothetical protein JM83_1600 [Gillisia sp. Hel_I_86]
MDLEEDWTGWLILSSLKEFLIFLSNPRERIEKKKTYSNFRIIKKFIFYCLFISLLSGLLILIMNQFTNSINEILESEKTSKNGILDVFYLITIYPIIEELGFRLSLKIRKDFLSISLAIQLTYLCLISFDSKLSIATIFITILFSLILWLFIIKKRFTVYPFNVHSL